MPRRACGLDHCLLLDDLHLPIFDALPKLATCKEVLEPVQLVRYHGIALHQRRAVLTRLFIYQVMAAKRVRLLGHEDANTRQRRRAGAATKSHAEPAVSADGAIEAAGFFAALIQLLV
jgi:hypothetical protein